MTLFDILTLGCFVLALVNCIKWQNEDIKEYNKMLKEKKNDTQRRTN